MRRSIIGALLNLSLRMHPKAIDNEDAGKKFLAVGYLDSARTVWYVET